MPQETKKAGSMWVRAQVFVLTLLLAAMVFYRFALTDPPGEIDIPLLAVVGIIVILILSEAFDNFSVGKLISISRRVEEKEEAVRRLETRNEQLVAQLVTLSVAQKQNQASTTVLGDYHASPRVVEATEEEVEADREVELETAQRGSARAATQNRSPRRRMDFRKVEEFGFQRYASEFSIDASAILRDRKVVSDFDYLDGITNRPPVFDGFVKSADKEVFIDVRMATKFGAVMMFDRLYFMLSKVKHYRDKADRSARLDLVLIQMPDGGAEGLERLVKMFQPAIDNGLLKIIPVAISEDEAEGLYREE